MKRLVISSKVTNRDISSFKQYLKDISSIPIMTPEEEKVCTRKIVDGDEDALNELVKRNLRFVVSVAKQYATIQNPLEDLVNEGNIGLIIAARKFNPDMGFRFISYAVSWIRKIIMEHLAKHGRLIRLPANKLNSLSKLDKKINLLEQKLGNPVDISEIISEFGDEIIAENPKTKSYLKVSDEYEFLSFIKSHSVDSLDRLVGRDDDNNTSLADTIPDFSFIDGDSLLEMEDIKTKVSFSLNRLKPRDRKIIVELYGLNGEIPRSLKDIGDEMGISREMVRQIKEKSLLRLKCNMLKECLV